MQNSGIGDYWVDMGINASHYSGPHHVLFEGNWGDNLDNDNTHGNSMYITFFRNEATGLRTPFIDPSLNKDRQRFAGIGYACGTTGPSGCRQIAPGPLRAAGPMAYNYWFAFVGNVSGGGGRDDCGVMVGPIKETGLEPRIFMLGWNAGPGASAAKILTWTEPAGRTFSATATMTMSTAIVDWTSGYSQTIICRTRSICLSAPSFFSAGASCTYPWPWVTPTGSSRSRPTAAAAPVFPPRRATTPGRRSRSHEEPLMVGETVTCPLSCAHGERISGAMEGNTPRNSCKRLRSRPSSLMTRWHRLQPS